MNILVTGARGFVGQNLVATLINIKNGKDKSYNIDNNMNVFEYDLDSDESGLEKYCKEADFIFHLAGVNRPLDAAEYMEGNYGFTLHLLDLLRKYNNQCPIMLASSTQAELNNAYGISKKAGEDLLLNYAKERGVDVYIYRFPNIFGKWCRPNYNSVVATFCYNIAHGLPIRVDDENKVMDFVYIDDVINELINALKDMPSIDKSGFCRVSVVYSVTLGELAKLLYSFQKCQTEKEVPSIAKGTFAKKMYATYLTYLPENALAYSLEMKSDNRGSFTEIIRTPDRGQFSVNVIKPGVTKGEHWHHTKHEKFVVVSGKGLIQIRRVGMDPQNGGAYPVVNYHVSGEDIKVIDIPPGYTHNIINEGKTDLIVFIWGSECFEESRPDTYFLKVDEETFYE